MVSGRLRRAARLLPRRPKLRLRCVQRRRVPIRHALPRRHDGGDRPEPPKLGRSADIDVLVDATDDLAIGQDVIILALPPLVGREYAALEDEVAQSISRRTFSAPPL